MVLGQHVMTHEAGTIGTKAGPLLSAGDSIEITLHGSGAHGSMPHLSVDPVVLASTIVMRLQTVVSREIPPSSFAVLTVGSIQAGSKSNIIPATATLLLNMRTYDEDVRSTMITALERIVRAQFGDAVFEQSPQTASEDFSIVPSAFGVPCTYWTVGGVSKGRLERAESSDDPADQIAPNHSSYFYPDIDPTLECGTKALLAAALAWLG